MFGRVEVYHHQDFFKSGKTESHVGAVVGRFLCKHEKTVEDKHFIDLCKFVCKQVYEADGQLSNIDRDTLDEILETKSVIEQRLNEQIEMSDFEYVTL